MSALSGKWFGRESSTPSLRRRRGLRALRRSGFGGGSRRVRLALLALLICLPSQPGRGEAPPLPSSYFGSAEIAGAPAPAGSLVSAWLGGAPVASALVFSRAGEASYRLDVPGDRVETPEVEGPVEGQPFEIRVGGAPATTAIWQGGTYQPLALAAASGADLRVQLSDGESIVAAGASLVFVAVVANDGPGSASGVALRAELPAAATLLAASDGGALVDGDVVWPPFALAEATTATRSFTVAIGTSVPSGVDTLEVVAAASHDGSGGADPDPSDDRATDVDLLQAAPDLAVTLSDSVALAVPGSTLIARLAVVNQGSQGATGVAPTLDLPPGVEFFSASHGGAFASGRVTWPAVALAVGATLDRAVTVRVPADLDPGVTSFTFEASVLDDGANGPDLDPADNLASDSEPVGHAPDLAIELVGLGAFTTDVETLAVAGEVAVEVANRGTLGVASFGLVVFSDLDGDGDFDATHDATLGLLAVAGLAAHSVSAVSVPVTGVVRFRGDRVFAKVDPELAWAELDETNNVGDTSAECEAPPAADPFTPVLERAWPVPGLATFQPGSIDSLSTPIVVQLTDDNGDGRWDDRDVPDVVFVTTNFYELMEPQIYLRAIRGDSGTSIFDVNGFLPHPTAPTAFSFSGLAAGDIDNDGKPELVTTTFGPAPNNTLVALEHNGVRKWQSAVYHTHPSPTGLTNRDNPTIADLNADGFAEIVVGANVFDRFGHLLWRGSGGQAYQSSGNSGDRGGAISAVADVDLDGRLEVVTGNTLYRHDGSIVWQVPLGDGYPAVANFDADPQPEIVVVSQGSVRLHDSDGTLIWGPIELPGSNPEAGGAPTVADFDGDGAPEIGVAGSDVYVVFETDGSIRWQASTQDYTSNLTGSTVFDLDGDGAFEVIYRDERKLRIYRGSDGVVLFEDVVSSNTWTEEPVVADVDRDGNAEILVTSDRAPDVPMPSGQRTAGLRIYGDAGDGWTWARPIWNQHAFTPDQVEDDARIPRRPAWGWLDHNTFRANRPPGGDSGAAPNLTASRILVDLSALPLLRVSARVGNGGRTPVGPGLPVAFYDGASASGGALLGVVPLASGLAPGAFLDVAAEFALPLPASGAVTVVADDDGTGAGRERECDESDNAATLAYDAASLGLWIALDDGTTAVSPGETVTYQIEASNAFAGTATGVVILDTLPEHTVLMAASDGGVEAGGSVTWPAISLASGARAIRTLTLQVDPALPLAVTSIANQAQVSDDGGQGPDPSPWNNQASDIDAVSSVSADAGGPYLAAEGETVTLDASGSFDRDGALVAFEWDLDGDGAFDDASGMLATYAAVDEGLFAVRLRVTGESGESDVAATTVAVTNVAPSLTVPAGVDGIEGTPMGLDGILAQDPGLVDSLVATVAWGDGASESLPVVGGEIAGTHRYVEDGAYLVNLCVADGDGGQACAALPATIANAAPEIQPVRGYEFSAWQPEELNATTTTEWSISTGGATATERNNGQPTLLVGDLPAFGSYEVGIRVADSGDDDFVGLALGYRPGDFAAATADFLLIDWKRGDQAGARRGLALSRVLGAPTATELLLHIDQAANGTANRVVELARGIAFGQIGWARHTDYRFRVEYDPNRLRVWVDDALELDVTGAFPAGRLSLYDYSQANAIFTALGSALVVAGAEGSTATLRAGFTDAGRADLHSAQVEWGDALSSTATVSEEEGQGEVFGQHVYVDDGDYEANLCVADDDGGSDCAILPARIENRSPALALVLATSGFREDPVALTGTTFTDPGVLDTHAATVDWGDGPSEAATVVEVDGAGTISGSHLYPAVGEYLVRVCVDDGDGGHTCDQRGLSLVERSFDLALAKTVSPGVARPGQRVTYTLRIENQGTLPATGVVAADLLPANLVFVSASGSGVYAAGAITWALGALAPGAVTTRTLVADVAAGAPAGAVVVNAASVTDDGASGVDQDPADNAAAAPLRISDAVSPIVAFATPLAGAEGVALALSGVTYADTTASELHSATVAWGDGAVTPATLTPAVGRSGSITAQHVFVDDGGYSVEVCVSDTGGNVGCSSGLAAIANLPPQVADPGAVDLHLWRVEELVNDQLPAQWNVAADGLSVFQSQNSRPSVLYGPYPATGNRIEGVIRVEASGAVDDDFIGFVLGFDPGDFSATTADYLVVDWKRATQTFTFTCGARQALQGLAVSRATGVPAAGEFWGHLDESCNGAADRVEEIGRASALGTTGYTLARDYHFSFEYDATHLRIWVDGVLQIDLAGSFPPGRFGFYNYSQQSVRYRGFLADLTTRYEGETFELEAGFADFGVADTHSARVDWDDGSSAPAEIEESGGSGIASASRRLLDDGDYRIGACVTDDDGAEGCGSFPLVALNLPPVVDAAPDGIGVAGLAQSFDLATFHDPGALDSHTATVDWGDGLVGPTALEEDDGEGSVSGAHTFASPGSYPVTVCVRDDDGAAACGSLAISVLATLPSLQATKTVQPVDRDGDGQVSPGDELIYRIELANQGAATATGVRFEDPIPAFTHLIPGSVSPPLLVQGENPVEVEVPSLSAGASLLVQFAVTIDSPLPAGVREIVNSGLVTSAEGPPVPTDDPALPGPADPTRIPVVARPSLTLEKSVILVDLDGDGVATPGDELDWTLEARVTGTTAATGVVAIDALPSNTVLVAGSVVASRGTIVGLDPLILALEELEVGATATLGFRTRIDSDLPGDVEEIANQASVATNEVDALLSDDPETAEPADPTRVPVYLLPTLSVTGATMAEGDAGTLPLRFGVALDRPSRLPVTADWTVTGGTATAGEDFLPAGGTLTLAPGETTAELMVPVLGDEVVETDETLHVTIANPHFAHLGAGEAIGVVLNDDSTAIGVADSGTVEGDVAVIVLSLTAPSALPVQLDWATADGTASGGADYLPASGSAQFAPLATTATIAIGTVEDEVPEVEESFRILLSNAGIAGLPDPEAAVTIADDDPTFLSIDDASVVEGDAGSTPVTLPIRLSRAHTSPVTVAWATVAESATEGADYLAASGTAQFAPGETLVEVGLEVVGESAIEPDETLRVELSNPTLAELADPVATVTIVDDDTPDCALACPAPLLIGNDPGACGAVVELPEPTPTGACGVVTCTPPSGALFPVGTTTVLCGASVPDVGCSFEVTVLDTEAPGVAAPNLAVGSDTGFCGAAVDFAVDVTDNCPGAGVATCDPPSGAFYPVGTTPVQCSAADAAGNGATGSGSVTVVDVEPPQIAACPADASLLAPPGALSWPYEFETPAGSDNCPGVGVACDPTSGSAFPVGSTAVVCSATDAAGLSTSCSFEVDVGTQPAVEIPALSGRALALLALALAFAALRALGRDPEGS